MHAPGPIRAVPVHAEAIRAVADLLEALKLQSAFVGSVARAGWLGEPVESGSIDVLAILAPERMRQVPTMASHRGFRVDPQQVERGEELDLIPLSYKGVRIHVLMATNALYGRMIAPAVEARLDESSVRIVAAEDLALLLLVADDQTNLDRLLHTLPELDVESLNRKLAAIGLRGQQIVR
jgi:hypothetical protein